jgi:amino acid adenylation domain-containing protein
MLDRSDGISLRSGFLRHLQLRPEAAALVVRGETRSYRELESKARQLATAITQACGGDRPGRVGIFAYRSETAYTGTLAALFAGGTFVPLNPTFPTQKTAAMIERAELDAMIVDSACLVQVPNVLGGIVAVPLILPEAEADTVPHSRAIGRSEIATLASLKVLPALTAEDIAFLLFTSGSTGVPKGVPVTHGNAVHFMDVMSHRYGISPDDRFSQTFDQTFDLSVFDLFMAWSNGACVCSMSPVELLAPTKFINHHRITVWFSVPSVPALMSRRKVLLPNTMPMLRWSLFCGEPLLQSSAEAWQKAAPNSTVENLYGPTELTIACLAHRWNPATSPELCVNGIVPIGRPCDGLAVVVVDDDLKPVGEGETGELCVSGPQTTPGYWRAPETTAQRYLEIPVGRLETRRFYRTGDVVARHPSGDYVFLGRADQQIKIFGHRIELGEIEEVLRRYPGVEEAVAFGLPTGSATAESVVAFVLGNISDADALINFSRLSLPRYAVPRRIFALEELPLNVNGKVDRRALQERLAEFTPSAGQWVKRV